MGIKVLKRQAEELKHQLLDNITFGFELEGEFITLHYNSNHFYLGHDGSVNVHGCDCEEYYYGECHYCLNEDDCPCIFSNTNGDTITDTDYCSWSFRGCNCSEGYDAGSELKTVNGYLLKRLFKLVDSLELDQFQANTTCGLHVHVGIPADIKQIIYNNQHVFAKHFRPLRVFRKRKTEYCKPLSWDTIDTTGRTALDRSFKGCEITWNTRHAIDDNTNTVEFRLFDGDYKCSAADDTKGHIFSESQIKAYIKLCVYSTFACLFNTLNEICGVEQVTLPVPSSKDDIIHWIASDLVESNLKIYQKELVNIA